MKTNTPQERALSSPLLDALMPLHASLAHKIAVGSLIQLQTLVGEWQQETFGDQPVEAKIKHLIHEANELLADPSDRIEMADILILLLGISSVERVTIEELVEVAWAKFTHNKTRKWGPPDAHGVCHHIEEERAA